MRVTKILIIIFATLFIAANAYGAGSVGVGTIKTMQTAYGDRWAINTNGNAINPDNCNKNTITLRNTNGQYDEIFSLLLAAYVSAKPVTIYVNGCDEHGYKKFSFVHTSWNQ